MVQCPVCFKDFASNGYLNSHLQQTKCLLAFYAMNHNHRDSNSTQLYSQLEDCSSIENDRNQDEEQHDNERKLNQQVNVENSNLCNTLGVVECSGNVQQIEDTESFNVPMVQDTKIIPMLRIIQTVRQAGAPLNLVDNIVKILTEEAQAGRLDIAAMTTYRTTMNQLGKLFPALPRPAILPISHERTLEEMKANEDRPRLTFPSFSFLGQLKDLLDDHVFSDISNLVVDPENRWCHYGRNSCPHSKDEIQDGDWFQNAVESVKSLPSQDGITDFVFGIQGYVDKTGTDSYMRSSVEPFVFTLTLLCNKARNIPKHWRVLALLPPSISQSQKKKYVFGASVRNYHIALNAALKEFIDLQKDPPLVRLRLGNQFQWVRAHFFWVNTIADGLANEHLVGRIQNRTSSPRLSRGCHCPQHLADDWQHQCRYLNQAPLERLVMAALGPLADSGEWSNYLQSLASIQAMNAAKAALERRKKMAKAILKNVFGQHVVDLVWFHVDQGPNPRGCFGSTAIDPMHVFEEGIVPNVLSVILEPLSDTAKTKLDRVALDIVAANRWSTEYPRMNFSGGFTSLTQLTADEKVGKLLLLWITMQTPIGREVMSLRCNPSFDEQKQVVAAKFTSNLDWKPDIEDEEGQNDDDSSDIVEGSGTRGYNGSDIQIELVDAIIREHGLHFILPWIFQMAPHHQELLRKAVFDMSPPIKGRKHSLPELTLLDRRNVTGDVSTLYYRHHEEEGKEVKQGAMNEVAKCSVDCSVDELQLLLEMLLSFHAAYKYGSPSDKSAFDQKIRLMMKWLKKWIKRGSETKNWSISKFHELLHLPIDNQNFGSQRNVDAGKGEHGLKSWAKLPAKTVRKRSDNLYYKDLATRIHENRLLEIATDTMLAKGIPSQTRKSGHEDSEMANENEDDQAVFQNTITIEFTKPLLTLQREGPTTLFDGLSAFLRQQTKLNFPLTIFQEATYSSSLTETKTIRSSPNFRGTGAWRDWVLVRYENNNGEETLYPFQIFGFFHNGDVKTAVGKMGQHRRNHQSRLLQKWSIESRMRLVDLETIAQPAVAISVPKKCCQQGEGANMDHFFLLKDRIDEWPSIFNTDDWDPIDKKKKSRKRKQ